MGTTIKPRSAGSDSFARDGNRAQVKNAMKRLTASPAGAAAFQLAVMALASAVAALAPLLLPALNATLKVILQWITLPLLGGLTAGALARSGVTHYLAWLMPPVLVAAVPWLIVGFPLPPGFLPWRSRPDPASIHPGRRAPPGR